MKRIVLPFLICVVAFIGYSAHADLLASAAIGARLCFVGGPLLTLVVDVTLADQLLLDLTLGTWPGALLRAEANLRYRFLKGEWSPYLQGGIGYVLIFESNMPYNEVKEVHLSGGLAYELSPSLTLSADAGLLWAPPAVNPQVAEAFPNTLPIVPMISVGAVYAFQE